MAETDYNKFWSPAFDDMGDFVLLLDEGFNLVKANKIFVEFIGKNENELIGKKCYSLVHNSTNPPPECKHQKSDLVRSAGQGLG
jgi:PAS domain S-box-containing protein